MIRSIGSPTNRPSLLVDYTVLRNVGRVILEGIEKKGDNVNSTDIFLLVLRETLRNNERSISQEDDAIPDRSLTFNMQGTS
ncbi:hypothetical protein OUZ56_007503 [Daphnia magna]|uniref:GMP synthase n=1 Tax=Daphnia magna TaxID=35525 RepID=A0ABR0AA55_9CRUS|nr:hypothetical protein OUZ56_007503 [Daphnia magna]